LVIYRGCYLASGSPNFILWLVAFLVPIWASDKRQTGITPVNISNTICSKIFFQTKTVFFKNEFIFSKLGLGVPSFLLKRRLSKSRAVIFFGRKAAITVSVFGLFFFVAAWLFSCLSIKLAAGVSGRISPTCSRFIVNEGATLLVWTGLNCLMF
jgi:hypothetical protein